MYFVMPKVFKDMKQKKKKLINKINTILYDFKYQ